MSQNKKQKQVSLAGAAKTPKEENKRKFPWKWIGLGFVLLVLLAFGILLFQIIDMLKTDEKPSLFNMFKTEEKLSLTAREMVEYEYTPDDLADDVSYFLLGVTGDEIGSTMDMLAVMCYDRKADSVSVVQIPVATYIDKDNGFAVDTIGDVWYNPQPVAFCSACNKRVPEKEIDGTIHGTCGEKLEDKIGSATGDLARVINTQYGLPIDNYLIVPRQGLAELIDALEGVEVELSKNITLNEEPYESGVQTLSGAAAMEYAITYNYKNTPASDRERMGRQRQVIAALWQKLATYKLEDLYSVDKNDITRGIIGKMMIGEHPVRFNTTSFGKGRLLGVDEKKTEDIKLADAFARFVVQMGEIPLDKVTFSILPGEEELKGSAKVYSVNRAQVIDLLNEQMNPCDLTLDEDAVTAPQISEVPDEAELSTATLDTVLPNDEVEETESDD